MLALIWLACSGPALDAPSADDRRRALVWQDREQVLATFPQVVALASDPDPAVRSEALRSLGWSRDPRALPILAAARTTDPDAAIDGLAAFGTPEACALALAAPVLHTERVYRWLYQTPCGDPPP